MSKRKPMKPLTPPDPQACQAELGGAFMLGPGLMRCGSPPAAVVIERRPGADGRVGSMSLCKSCLAEFQRRNGDGLVTVVPLAQYLATQALGDAREAAYVAFSRYLVEAALADEALQVASAWRVAPRDLFFGGRDAPQARGAQREFWWRLVRVYRRSYAEVARLFGRDASSVSKAVGELPGRAEDVRPALQRDAAERAARYRRAAARRRGAA